MFYNHAQPQQLPATITAFYPQSVFKYFVRFIHHVRNEQVLLRVKEHKNILHEISKRKANWIGHILRRNCLLQQVIEGKIEGGHRSDGKTRKKT
jgi:hypothetical protein